LDVTFYEVEGFGNGLERLEGKGEVAVVYCTNVFFFGSNLCLTSLPIGDILIDSGIFSNDHRTVPRSSVIRGRFCDHSKAAVAMSYMFSDAKVLIFLHIPILFTDYLTDSYQFQG